MAKKTDDYTYPDQTTNTEYTESATSENTETIQSMLMNKRIMMPLGIMALVILINVIWGGEEEKPPVVAETKEEPKVPMNEGVSAQELEFAKMQSELQAEKMNENKKAIDKFTQSTEEQRSQLSDVQRKFNNLQNDVNALKNNVETINNELIKTTIAINALVSEITAMKKPKVKKRVVKKRRVIPRNYYIRAIIDGRAWVKWDKGASLSVAVGDNIPTYGKVTAIMPVEGVVQTSSGRVIQFSPNE